MGKEEEFDTIADEENFEEGSSEALKRLREKLAKAVEEKQEYLDQWQRSRADLANFKRDESQRSQDQSIRSKMGFAEAVIPALDSFEMALQDKSFATADANLKKGITAVYNNLLKSLQSIGVTRFDPTGETFNPHQHEALREMSTEEKEKEHTVAELHRAGYKINLSGEDRIVRPAQVSVYAHTISNL